jgi:hypothetical protein
MPRGTAARAPSYVADLTALPLPSGWSFARASIARQRGAGAVYSQVPANVPRLSYDAAGASSFGVLVEATGRQQLRNSAALGVGTTIATWTLTQPSGVTPTLTGRGTLADGRAYVDVRVSGTPAVSSSATILMEESGAIAATSAQTVAIEMDLAVVAGSLDGITSISLAYTSRDVALGVLGTQFGTALALDGTARPFAYAVAPTNVLTASVQPGIRIAYAGGVAVGVTLRIIEPQVEIASAVSSRVVTRLDDAEILPNAIPTPASWGSAGTPGTLPTGWALTAPAGMTRAVVAVGADFTEIRLSGTPSATASVVLTYTSNTAISAVQGDTVAVGTPAISLTGNAAGVTIQQAVVERTAAGGALVTRFGPSLPLDSTARPYSWMTTMQQATAGRVQPALRIALTNAVSADFTIRIQGTPRCGLNAAVRDNRVRAAETLAYALGPWFSGAAGSLVVRFAPSRAGAAYTLVQLDDGTADNRVTIASPDGLALRLEVVSGGVASTPVVLTTNALAAGELGAVGLSWSAGQVRASLNGLVAASIGANPLSGATTLRLGCDVANVSQGAASFARVEGWSA